MTRPDIPENVPQKRFVHVSFWWAVLRSLFIVFVVIGLALPLSNATEVGIIS